MSEFDDFGGSMSFTTKVDERAMITPFDQPSTLLIQLADDDEWLERKISGYKAVIIRYHGEEYGFTPYEVLRALCSVRQGKPVYAQVKMPKETQERIEQMVHDEVREHLKDIGIIRCKDCKHAHMTTGGKSNKWCSVMATHDIKSDSADPPNGYDPEPYFDADFFCGFGEPREGT